MHLSLTELKEFYSRAQSMPFEAAASFLSEKSISDQIKNQIYLDQFFFTTVQDGIIYFNISANFEAWHSLFNIYESFTVRADGIREIITPEKVGSLIVGEFRYNEFRDKGTGFLNEIAFPLMSGENRNRLSYNITPDIIFETNEPAFYLEFTFSDFGLDIKNKIYRTKKLLIEDFYVNTNLKIYRTT